MLVSHQYNLMTECIDEFTWYMLKGGTFISTNRHHWRYLRGIVPLLVAPSVKLVASLAVALVVLLI